MFNITSLLLKNYYYRLTQMLYNLMNIILIPFGSLYFFISIFDMVNKNPGNDTVRYIYFILLILYSIIVILYAFGYILFSTIDTSIYTHGILYNIGLNVFSVRDSMNESFIFRWLGILWNWFLSPFALSVICKSLGVFQNNGYTTLYYIIYFISLIITAFAYKSDECYNDFV